MKKKLLIILSAIICIIVIGVFILAGKSISPSEGIFLDAGSSKIILLDGSPVVMTNHTGKDDAFENYNTGDKLLVLHDGILESYPARTGVYFIIKLGEGKAEEISETVIQQLADMGWFTDAVTTDDGEDLSGIHYSAALFDVKSVFSYSTFDYDEIKAKALNADKMPDENATHLPVFRFDIYEEFDSFINFFRKDFGLPHSDDKDFLFAFTEFDREYFNENSLFLVYYTSGSSNSSTNLKNVSIINDTLSLNFSTTKIGDAGASVTRSHMVVIGVEKSFLNACRYTDAILFNETE